MPRLKWPAIAVVLIAAGAAAWVNAPLGDAAHAATTGPPWRVVSLPVSGPGPFSYAEPGIAAGAGDSVLVDSATANTGAPPTLWISRDGGSTWADGRDFDSSGAATGDADAAIGADGSLYGLNLGYNPNPPGQPANPTVLVYRSADGRSWSGPASFPAPHGADQPDRPWLMLDPRNAAHVDVVNSEGGGNIVIWHSLDHGAQFSGPSPVTGGPNSQAALAFSSRPLFDPSQDQRVYMLYETATSSGAMTQVGAGARVDEFPLTQLWLATSVDGGLTWGNRMVLDTAALPAPLTGATLGHLLVASAIDAAGNLYAALSLRPGASTQTDIYFIHSTTHGATWSAPVKVDAPTKSNVMPALAVTPGGVAYLSWYGSPADDFGSSTAPWAELLAQTSDPLAAQPHFTVAQVSGTVPVHVGGIDTAGTTGQDAGANWGLRDFQSIAVDACGQPHPVWADDNTAPPATQTVVPQSLCAAGAGSPSLAPGAARPVVPAPGCNLAARLRFRINRVPGGRVVRVAVSINGHSVVSRRGHDLRSVSVPRPPGTRLQVRIVTTNDRGGKVITVRSFIGCRRTPISGRVRRHARRPRRPA